jgi:ABC-type transport system substrate-binding protein
MRKGLSLVALLAGCGLLAASALASARQAPPAGIFRMSLSVDIDYIDPALSYYGPAWVLQYATGALLYNYPDAPAPRGSRLVPEVAAGFPAVSRDGRTYTFKLERTYRLSNGERITARNFAWALNRVLNRRMGHSAAQPFVEDIVGAEDVMKGNTDAARGIKVLGAYTLRIRLTHRAPDLLARLAMPFFQAVSVNLPIDQEGVEAPLASGGPYFFREWTNDRRIVLGRNPYYRGPRPHRVGRIDVYIGHSLETTKLNIDRGATDTGDIPPAAHAELGRTYGVKRRSPGRYFANPTATMLYLAFNHDRPLFGGPGSLGNVRLKKAVNFAIDRRRLVLQYGAYAGMVTDQILPSTIRGFRDASLYPRHPRLDEARRLAAGSTRHGRAVFYCGNRSPQPMICNGIVAQLREIGIVADLKLEPRVGWGWPYRNRGEPFDLHLIAVDGGAYRLQRIDGPFDPYTWFEKVDGSTLQPAGNVNLSYFNDSRYNRRLRAAKQLAGARRYRAFANLDRDLMRTAAPIAPIGQLNERHYVSARTGCYHHHPVYGFDLPAICLRR